MEHFLARPHRTLIMAKVMLCWPSSGLYANPSTAEEALVERDDWKIGVL